MSIEPLRHFAQTPRMFGPFLRRIDPMLRLEDENPVFEAFRRRRTVHSRALRTTIAHWTSAGALSTTFLIVMILILGIIGILIAIIAVALGQFVGTFVKKDGCPPSARMLIRKNGYQKATTRDLWMSGVTGSEIAEAIVLEDAMMQRIGSTIGLIIGTLGAVIAAGIILYTTQFWGILLPALAFVYMVVEAVRHAWVNSLKSTFRGLRERLATMEGLASRESTGVRAAKNAAMSLIKVIGIFVLLLLSICVLGGILGSAVDLISPHNVAVIACLTITGVCLFVGFRLHTHRRRFWFRNYKEFRRICLKYDFVFDQFVRVAILEDHQAWLEAMPVQHTTDFWGPTPIQIETADNDDGIRP